LPTVGRDRGAHEGSRLLRHGTTAHRGLAARAAAIGAGWFLLLAIVAVPPAEAGSCKGASHGPPVLANGAASPGTGTPATTVTFSVTYTDAEGCAPTSIDLVVVGVGQYPMSGPGSGFAGGVTFVVSRTLPPGTWDYDFTATSGTGAGEKNVVLTQASPSRVAITAPTPRPTAPPPPPPPPKPTPKPAPPKPSATTPPVARATPAPPAPKPPAKPPSPPPAASPSPDPVAPGGSPAATPSPPGHVALAGGVPPDDRGRPGQDGGGGGAGSPPTGGPGALLVLGTEHDAGPGTVAIGLVAAAASVLAMGVLAAAVRRRRRDDSVAAAAAVGTAPTWTMAAPAPLPPPPVMDAPPPWQTLTGRAPEKFASGPASGVERRTISYRFVRLSDGPDDLRSREIGRLDRGDEVEVLGEQDGMLQVRTPTGLLGWVPRVVIVG
jgi:hypothetical protein